MPSGFRRSDSYSRSRSRSPDRRREREKSKDRSRSPDERRRLPHDASPISESDYFQKSDEFRVWLKDEKGKYFDELSGDRARSYFRKFVKAWNRGKLPRALYHGVEKSSIPQTGYKWSFSSKTTRADNEALRQVRESVGAATDNRAEASSSRGRLQGPTMPSAADRQLAIEAADEMRDEDRKYKRKQERKEAKERIEDMVGPKEMGREGQLEKKRAQRENDRAFREKGDEGLEVDESTLMGGGDSFQAHIARREAGRKRFEQSREEKTNSARERASAFKEKESATIAMFQQLAKQRFG